MVPKHNQCWHLTINSLIFNKKLLTVIDQYNVETKKITFPALTELNVSQEREKTTIEKDTYK